jgi:2-polyprenyl-3-methyl-5-hydroxy-6-metoxy-1,4-benzoquinol methylase
MDFIADRLTPGARCWTGLRRGRFSVEFARLGCAVTLFDLSPVQIAIAKEKTWRI